MDTLDCRGLPCPGPVLRCKQCVETEHPQHLHVTVDNPAARENVSRFLSMHGYTVTVTTTDDLFMLDAIATGATQTPPPSPAPKASPSQEAETTLKTLVLITSETMGRGDPELGGKLMFNFLSTLPELGEGLWRIILLNGGVKLSVTGSPVLEKLKALTQAGVSILVCGTCLDFFGILDQKEVGETTNMLDVVTSLDLADKVIQI